MTGGVINQSTEYWTQRMQKRASVRLIERVHMIGGSDVHHAIYDDRSDFKIAGISTMEYPLRTKLPNILGSDLRQTAEAPSGVISIVRRPILVNRMGE